MNGHHPDFIASRVHVPPDHDLRALDGREEMRERGDIALLVIEREPQKFVNGIAGFGAEPGEHVPSATLGTEHGGVKPEWAGGAGQLPPGRHLFLRGREARRTNRRAVQRIGRGSRSGPAQRP